MTPKEKILNHKTIVRTGLRKVSDNLDKRGFTHDNSKLTKEEFPYFENAIPMLDKAVYLSPEYAKGIEILGKGLEHHYANNSHHPEYYQTPACVKCNTQYDPKVHVKGCPVCGGVVIESFSDMSRMSLMDLMEMLVDWKAATEMTKDGDIYKSIEKNQRRFGYSDELKSILLSTLKELEDK